MASPLESQIFGSQLSWSILATFCRSLGTLLHSGVNILKAVQVAGGQSRHSVLQKVSLSIVDDLRKGQDIATSLRAHPGRFPELMIDLVSVAEETGSLPEVLASLADHYENLLRLRRSFIGAIAWPLFQLVAAVLIVAGLIFIMGLIASGKGGEPMDVLGLGFTGASGALMWLFLCFGSALSLFIVYQLLSRGLRGRAAMHAVVLRIPVLGYCLRSFAMARFSWAFALTQQAGMPISPSLEASLKATANGSFAAAAPQVIGMVQGGEDLSEALAASHLFPVEYLELVRVGEATGTVPETLERLSPQLEEQARRSLAALTGTLAWMIWALVAMMIVFIVFRIFMIAYIGPINDLLKQM